MSSVPQLEEMIQSVLTEMADRLGTSSEEIQRVRLLWITTIPIEMLSAHEALVLYRARWQAD